jgi:tetratricopeptide (TPR) repeat protein
MAKRVNKRFLVILTTVVLVGGVAGMGAMIVLQKINKKDPQQLVQESERLEKEGDFEGAIQTMQAAAGSRQQDPELRIKLGDLYYRTVAVDQQNFGKAREAWEGALSIDPAYKPALERHVDALWTYMELYPQHVPVYRAVREAAARLLAADPQNFKAQARMHIATVCQAEINATAKAKEVEDSVKALWELAVKDPANADLPFYAIRGEMDLARETAKQLADLLQAREAVAKLVPEIEHMLKGQETNAEMQLRAAQLYVIMPQMEALVGGTSTTAPTSRPTRNRPAGEYTERVAAALAAALQHAKPTDPRYVEIQRLNVQWLRETGKVEEARKLITKLVEERGDDPSVRLEYAGMFQSDRESHAKLLEVLARPVDMTGVSGAEALKRTDLKLSLAQTLATLRLAALDTERDPAKRQSIIESVAEEVKKLEAASGGSSVEVLELKGRLFIVQGKLPDAIKALQQAVDRRGLERPNPETLLMLGTAYFATGETGQAEKLLRQFVEKLRDQVSPRHRALWIKVLMGNGQPDEARRELAEFKRLQPGAKEIAELEAMVEGGKALAEYVEKLPENTPAERVQKAMVLRGEGKVDEAIELADAAFKADPKFLPAVDQLLEMYLATDRRDEALEVAKAAMKANPDNEQLKSMPDRLAKRTPEELDKWRLEQISKEPDPVARELRSYEFYFQKSNAAAAQQNEEEQKKNAALAEVHLAAAEKLKPGDVRIDSRRFEFLLRQRRFDEAGGALLQKLASANSDEHNGQLLRYRLAIAKNDLGAAEAAARDITRQRAPFAIGWQLLGNVMHAQGRHPEAIEAYTAAIERQGKNYDALRGLIAIYYDLGDIAQAKATLDRARQAYPNDVALRETHLNHELTYGDPANAVAEREKLLKANPEISNNSLALADTYLRMLALESDPKKSKATIDKARAVLEAGIKKWPNDRRFQWPLAQVRLAQDDFFGGEAILKEYAAQPDADKVQADRLLTEYYRRANKPTMAEEVLRNALQRTNGAPDLKQALAALLADTGKLAEALKEIEGVPGPAAARQRVQLLVAAGKREDALKAIADAVAANPASLDLSNLQLDLLIGSGHFAEAEKLIQQRLAKSDRDDTARYSGAVIKMRKQPADIAGALTDLTKLAERNPRDVLVRALLGDAHAASGDPAAAIDDFAKAVELAPLNPDLRVKLIEACAGQRRWDAVKTYATEALNNPRLAKNYAWPRALAAAAAGTGQFAEAEKQIVQAISLVPSGQAGELEREHLNVLMQSKAYGKALKLTDEWLAKGRKEWWVYQYRGLAKSGLKDKTAGSEFDKALALIKPEEQPLIAETIIRSIATSLSVDEALTRVQKLEATDPRWRIFAAELCLFKPDQTAALAYLQAIESQVDKLPPALATLFYRLQGQAYHTMKPTPDLVRAAVAYQKYLELAPGDVLSLNNLAYLLAEEISPPRPEDAKIYSKKAYDIARSWKAGDAKGRILDTHGWVLILGQGAGIDEGIRVLEEAIEEYPIVEARYHLGEAHLLKKRSEEAEQQLTAALAMIEKAKKDKTQFDVSLEPRIQKALERAKAANASAAAP